MLNKLINDLIQQVIDQGTSFDGDEYRTYLGPIRHRLTNTSIEVTSPAFSLIPVGPNTDGLHPITGPLYLPKCFPGLIARLIDFPLRKSGLQDDPIKNLIFLKQESLAWIKSPEERGGELYEEMWSDIPNTSQYAQNAYDTISTLLPKVPELLAFNLSSSTRSFELRFPDGYCPVVWSLNINKDLKSLEGSLVFRSLEVSRNLANDLYLFFVYFGHVLRAGSIGQGSLIIPFSRLTLFVQDAHIIDFDA